MPTSAGPYTRARAAVSGPPASEQFHSAPAGPTRSEPPHPVSYASMVSPSHTLPAPAALSEYVPRHPSIPPAAADPNPSTPAGESTLPPPVPAPVASADEQDTNWAAFADNLLTEIQVLRSEVAASREEEARLREEMSELRTMVAVLDAVVTSHPSPDAPSGEEDDEFKKKKKKPTPRGDVPNRRKPSYDPEDLPTSEEDTSEEEEDEAVRAPRGRRVVGLKEQATRRPEFKTLVSYRTYRLANTKRAVSSVDTGKVNSYLKKLKHHLDYKFSGDPAIQVLDFLTTFKEAADLNGISEGIAVLILPYFLEGRAKSGLSSRLKQAAASLPKFPVAVQWLLQSFATEAVIAAACQKVFSAKQLPDEDEKTFANRLTRHAAEAGSVFTEDALISTFVDGLLPYAGNMVRGQVTPNMTFAEVQIHAEQVGAAGRAITSPVRYSPRLMPPGVHPVRPKLGIAAMAESAASSPHGGADSPFRSSTTPVVVAATERALTYEQGSELSAGGSDTSIPTRGWASAAGSVQDEAAFALHERNMNCHLCFTPGHFLMDCPLLGNETRQAALRQRETRNRDIPAARNRMSNPPVQGPPQLLEKPPVPPRYQDFRRSATAVHVVEHTPPLPADAMRAEAVQPTENETGDV